MREGGTFWKMSCRLNVELKDDEDEPRRLDVHDELA